MMNRPNTTQVHPDLKVDKETLITDLDKENLMVMAHLETMTDEDDLDLATKALGSIVVIKIRATTMTGEILLIRRTQSMMFPKERC